MSHHTWNFSRYKFLLGTAPVFVFAFLATVIGSSILTPINSTNAANPVTVSASVIRPAFALTLSVSPSVTLNLEPTPTGVMSVVSSTVSAATTSPSGYRLYLEMTGANSTDNSLIHTTDSNKKFTSSGTLKNPVALSNSTWGYAIAHEAPSANVENGFDASYTEMESASPTQAKFAAIPTSAGSAQRIAETNYVGGEDLTVYYGAKADYTTASGAYTNKVLYTALADNSDTHTMIVSPTTILPSGSESISLTTSLYSTAGEIASDAYLLTAEQYAAVTAAQNPTPVSTYSSQKMTCQRDTNSDPLKLDCTTVEVDAGSGYVYLDVPGYGEHFATEITVYDPTPTMQNFTVAECAAMSTGDSVTLKDSRDNNKYVVKKLAGGKCWMTQNLRLVGPFQPDQSDSDVTWTKSTTTFTLPAQNTGKWCTTGDETCNNTANNLYSGDSTYGTYYSWYAATAGTGTYSTSTDGANAPSSICPKGWRLPTGGSSGEFQTLYNNYKSYALMQGDPAFVLSGVNTGGQGGGGYYWSSTAFANGFAYGLAMYNSRVYPATYGYKNYGYSVRCVAR